MTVVVPPRELAATLSAQAILRTGWVLAFGYLAICAIIVIDLDVSRGRPIQMTVPLGALLVIVLALVYVFRSPSGGRGAVFLAVGSVAAFAFDYSLLASTPALNTDGTYLLTRVGIVLLLIGPVGTRTINGAWWCIAGYLLGVAAIGTAQTLLGLELRPGWGSLVSLVIYLSVIVTLSAIRWNRGRSMPDFSAIEMETARVMGQRELQERAVALIHDTVLNDLSVVAHSAGGLDERGRARFLRDISEVSAATVRPTHSQDSETGEQAGAIRNRLLALVREFQWQGLTVEVGSDDEAPLSLPAATTDALLGAVRSSLENVRKHSGVMGAEVVLNHSARELTVMVVDHGHGFDPAAVPADRLGLRSAVVWRLESCGGTIRIFSGVGAGTSIVMTVPLEAKNA